MYNSNVVLVLDTRRQKKDKTYPLIFRISHFGETISVRTGSTILEKDWDKKGRKVKKSYKGALSAQRLNNDLESARLEVEEELLDLKRRGIIQTFSIKELKKRITKEQDIQSVFVFMDMLIAELKKGGKIGNARAYNNTLGVLKKYMNEKDLKFDKITYSFLKNFEAEYLAKGSSINGLYFHMRTLRSTYNKAIKAGFVDEKNYPFNKYQLKKEPTEKRAIKLEDLKKIFQYKLTKEEERLKDAQNMFVASFYLRGMSIIDMAFLKVENIGKERVQYRRKKTSSLFDVKISQELKEILDYYSKGKKNNEFVFPVIKRKSLEDRYRDVGIARKKLNENIRELAKLCEIDEYLTFYVARHSFASLCNEKGVPLTVISQMLGHKSVKTTQVYLDSLSNKVVDEYQDNILKDLW